jgi:hypothetical protein
MKSKFPFKYNKVAALLMLAPLGIAHAATPVFLASSIAGTDFEIDVNPVVQLGANLVVEAGNTLKVPVKLLGQAPASPTEIVYTVTPSNTGLASGELTLSISETDKSPVISYELAKEQSGETIVIALVSASKAAVIATVIDENVAPVVSFTIAQADADQEVDGVIVVDTESENVTTVAGAAGLVTVTANIFDANTADEHCITFTSSDGALTEYVDVNDTNADCRVSNTYTFDPNLLDSGSYPLTVSVLESNTVAPFTTEMTIEIPVTAGTATVIVDSNSNGIPDSEESIDAVNDATQLAAIANEAPLRVAAGLSLSLGDIAKANTEVNGFVASVAREQVQSDLHYSDISTITNFNISGLQQLGDSVSVVIPLATDVVIPAGAVYRKFTELEGAWFDFVVDAENQLASAAKDAQGNCPLPNSVSYTEGLTEGDNCIQLTIEDGGLNDADSTANGRVVDPGVLVVENDNTPPEIVSLNTHAINSGEQFTLSAIVTDAEGDEFSYSWTQLDSDSALKAEVVDANVGIFTAPEVNQLTDLTFSLTVTDSYGDSASQDVIVKVSTVNLKPEHEVDRRVGSFGWIMGLFTLGGLALRIKRKNA